MFNRRNINIPSFMIGFFKVFALLQTFCFQGQLVNESIHVLFNRQNAKFSVSQAAMTS